MAKNALGRAVCQARIYHVTERRQSLHCLIRQRIKYKLTNLPVTYTSKHSGIVTYIVALSTPPLRSSETDQLDLLLSPPSVTQTFAWRLLLSVHSFQFTVSAISFDCFRCTVADYKSFSPEHDYFTFGYMPSEIRLSSSGVIIAECTGRFNKPVPTCISFSIFL